MGLSGSTYLYALATISVTFVGFSALLLVFRQRPPVPWRHTRAISCSRLSNLGNLWRRLGLPKRIDSWSLTSLQQRLMKTGGRL